MRILITNDDGIDSPFMLPLAKAFMDLGEVVIAAPAEEQSWISKAMSRFKKISLKRREGFPYSAFSLSGSPADCVNIALGHLLEGKPDLVVSGLNVGHNTGLSFIASSGTIGAALEAALHEIPSIAASMALRPEEYQDLQNRDEAIDPKYIKRAEEASSRLVTFAKDMLRDQSENYAIVHSLNFPFTDFTKAEIRETTAMNTVSSCLYKRDGDEFSFEYSHLRELREDHLADLKCLKDGHISYTRLDYSRISSAL